MAAAQSYGEQRGRPKDDPSVAAFRKIALLVDLVRDKSIRAETYFATYDTNERTLQRDLSQLRKIGKELGFTISTLKDGRVELMSFDRRPRRLDDAKAETDQLLARLGAAFGEPLLRQLGSIAKRSDSAESFIRFSTPLIVAGSRVAGITTALREAMLSATGRCKVRFRYCGRDGSIKERLVEPAHIVVRSGRYYLVGYDNGQRGWRVFALDMIENTPARAGTIAKIRSVPAEYDSDDAIGFIKSGGATHAVTVSVAASVAGSVSSRVWQREQIVEVLPDGGALITFQVSDIGEVVRWAFGFAPDAVIVAPPEAVALAKRLATKLADQHAQNVTASN
jgi:predicted DNA-binding transcriptional regulator YafY